MFRARSQAARRRRLAKAAASWDFPPLPRLRAQLRLSHSEPTGGDTPRIILRQGASVVKDTGERQ